MSIYLKRILKQIAPIFLGTMIFTMIADAADPTQEQMDVVRDAIMGNEKSCSPGSRCFISKERECLRLETANEQIRCLDGLHGK